MPPVSFISSVFQLELLLTKECLDLRRTCQGCPRHRRSGEAGKSLRACTDGGHSRLQERHSQCVRPTKCGSRLNDLHGRSQELRRFRTNRLQTYSTHSATARRPSQRREIGAAVPGSGHCQSTTMADWNLSWRKAGSTPGLSG